MKKLIYIAVILVLWLAACNSAATIQAPVTQPTLATQSSAAARQTEVIWYVRANAQEQKWETETIIPGFQKKYPNIRIYLHVVPWTDYDTRMQVMTAGGTPPDIWSLWGPSGFQDYVRRGLVADLTPFIERDKFDLSDFEPSVLDTYKVDGKIMGLPMLTTGSFLFYNKALFDKAGVSYPTTNWDDRTWTYDKFLEKCKALTKVTGDPKTDVYGCNLGLWPNDAYAWMWGKDIYPDSAYKSGLASTSALNDPLVIAAFQARQDIVWKFKYQPNPAAIDAMGSGDLFKKQKVAMQLSDGSGWWNNADIKDFKWAAAALPYGADGRRDVVFTEPWMMSSKTSHPNEAWTFLKYLAEAPQQETWLKLTGAPPVRKSLAEAWYKLFAGMKPEEVKEVHLGALKYGRESPNHLLVKFDQLDRIVGAALDPVLNNTAPASETLPEANQHLTETLIQIQAEFKP